MAIIGWVSKPIRVALGDFFCPACREERRFELKVHSNLLQLAKVEGFDWGENERVGELIERLDLPADAAAQAD